MPHHFNLRITAILLIVAGYGWAGGRFIPTDAPTWAYLFQFVMLLLLFTFAIGFLRAVAGSSGAPPKPLHSTQAPQERRNIIGLTIFASLTLVVNLANVIRGTSNSGKFGSHNNFADLVPIGLIIAGDVLWLLNTIGRPKPTPKRTAGTPSKTP